MSGQSVRLPLPRFGVWTRGAFAALLFTAFLLVLLVAFRYLEDGRPISRIRGMPGSLARLLATPPQYDLSAYGVAAPMGVAVAQDGTVYVAESGGERMVRHFGSDGRELGAFAAPGTDAGTRVPVYVAISPKGSVYVTDREAQTIYIFTHEGEFVGHVPSPFGDDGWQPLGVSFDHSGNIYVTEVTPEKHRVLVLDADGKLKFEFGNQGTGDGEFFFPNAVAVDKAGRMFVSDGNNGRVQMFDSAGKFLGIIGRGPAKGDLALPRGLAIDDADHLLFVVDTSRHNVQYYDISSPIPKFLNSFGDSGNQDSDLAFPTGISVAGGGHVYVADREHNRVTAWRY